MEFVTGFVGCQFSLKVPYGCANGFYQRPRGADDPTDGVHAHFADGAGGGFGRERNSGDHTNQRSQFVICPQIVGGRGRHDLCWALDVEHHGGLHSQNP